jgi:hypothetical protein
MKPGPFREHCLIHPSIHVRCCMSGAVSAVAMKREFLNTQAVLDCLCVLYDPNMLSVVGNR